MWSVVWAGLSLAACGAGGGRRAIVERIGGEPRVRSFASATAYEAYLRAELAVRRGAFELAVRQLELARVGDPSDSYLPARQAEVLALAGDTEGALSVARGAVASFPRAASGWLVLASLRSRAGDAAGATEAWSRALECAPEDPEVRAAVARGQGANGASVAHARESSPRTLPGDRAIAVRERAHHEGAEPTSRSARRVLAAEAWARGQWARVDRLLTPLVLGDPSAVSERVRVIEARVRDGRTGDAAPLVSGVTVRATQRPANENASTTSNTSHAASDAGDAPAGPDAAAPAIDAPSEQAAGAAGVPPSERARLWLLVGQPGVAAEEAQVALRADPDDGLAQYVLGVSLLAERSTTARGLATLARVPPSSPHFADARIAAARALDDSGLRAAAEELLSRTVTQLAGAEPVVRDRVRVAHAARLLASNAGARANALLEAVESDEGRQLRGVLRAPTDAASAERDLRARAGDAWLDARADALRAGLCLSHAGLCPDGEASRLLASAQADAPEAAETLRARALSTPDADEAARLRRIANERAPLLYWGGLRLF